jgi:hypothetical protein
MPKAERAARARLFDALEQAFPVTFVGREPDAWNELDAVLVLNDAAAPPGGLPALVAAADEATADEAAEVRVGSIGIDARLAGRTLQDRRAGRLKALGAVDGDVVASLSSGPAWVHRERQRRVAAAPAELDRGESLRDRLCGSRWLALLPLVELLREVTAADAWTPPPLRAVIIIDDPNLHWPTFGYLRFDELARHAGEHNYHAAMAMVPRDTWFEHPAAAKVFREHRDRLSLLVHGNDHLRYELARPQSTAEAEGLGAQALRRIRNFERRTGLDVARVMVAPHGRCSETTLRGLLAVGFEAACLEWPYWWRDEESGDGAESLEPARFFAGGLPVIPRHPLPHGVDDLLFRAYLGQPLVVAGHHDDAAHGIEAFADIAAVINGLGPARWSPVAEIARSNYSTRVEGAVLRIRLHARRVRVEVPGGIEEVVVELAPSHDAPEAEVLVTAADERRFSGPALEPFAVEAPTSFELQLRSRTQVDPALVALPGRRVWPIVRRVLSESKVRIPVFVSAPRRRG